MGFVLVGCAFLLTRVDKMVDPETHRVYAPEQEVDGKAAARTAVYEADVNP